MLFSEVDLLKRGFGGFESISELQLSRCRRIPDDPGVYCVLKAKTTSSTFLVESVGGHFKGKNPTVAVRLLETNWISDASVLYIGKAGGDSNATLRSRIDRYMSFGQGKPVGHRGGRYIWQLRDSQDLSVLEIHF